MPDDDEGSGASEDDGVGHSRLREVVTNESIPGTEGDDDAAHKAGLRRRARSLSDTLGEFFGVKRKNGSGSHGDGAVVTDTDGGSASDVDDQRPGPARA